MKKALDQTVRDLKREVNKKVLKVPSIEQKTLDATSNEPWGPRGSLMAEISQASCNYNDYQLIMAVLWKRIQDTGKNWRHVYKALSVLEYLVIYGSERVIDETREHAYQISTLSDFLYTDSNGRDQGSNVRKKSQTLVALVNNKERLQEVRHKALSNKDKVSRPPLSSSARYNDEHFEGGNREDGLVRERNLALRDKNRYHNRGDKYIQARDQYVKDKDEFNSSDDNYRIRANDDYQYRLRSQSVDGYTNNSFDDYDRHSTKSDGGRDGEILHDERIDAPPSYEVVTNDFCTDVQNDKGAVTTSMQRASSPSRPKETSRGTNPTPGSVAAQSAQAHEKEVASFDEFDPRGSVSAAPTVVSSGLELDIFGLSAVDYTDSSASLIVTSTAIPDDDVLTNSGLCANFIVASTAHAVPSKPDENPFGDAPFTAVPREESPSETNTSASATSQASSGFVSVAEINLPVEKRMEAAQSYDFGNTSGEPIYAPDVANVQHFLANPNSYASEVTAAKSSKDILDGILPWTGPVPPVPAYSASYAHNSSETGPADLQIGQINPFEQPELSNHQAGQVNPFEFQAFQPINANQMNFTENSVLPIPQISPRAPFSSHTLQPASLNGMQSSQMISMDKHGISHLHSGQSTVPADHQKLQINLSQQHNHSFQSIALSSMIPFQAVHSTVPGNVLLESAQLNPSQPVMAPAPQSLLGVPVSSQSFQSSPTIKQSPQINLQPFRLAASTSLQEAQQAAPSNIQTSQLSFTPHSALQDLLISSHGSAKLQPSNKKFEPKSVVWADTISRGLVNLNISGPKTNPLADIGINFDDINRKEKRNEAKSSQPPLPSSSSMGKAMGSGSGLGRAGTGAFIQPLNPTMGMGMGMNQPYMGMGMGGNMGMMHPSSGIPQQGPGIPGAYNTMNARGDYGQHHQS